jgi:sugar phosphate isomerase/epimerase
MRRRELLQALAGSVVLTRLAQAAKLTRGNLCFITDEVSKDLPVALQFADEFGVRQVELRNVYDKYCFRHEPAKLKEIQALLKKHGVRVAVVDTPIYKVPLPGTKLDALAEREMKGAQKDMPVPDEQQRAMQMDFLKQAIQAARIFETDRIRVFSYWRVEHPETVQKQVVDGLSRLAEVAEKEKVRLVLENENACNVANCAESMAVMNQIRSAHLGINWDLVNGFQTGETPYPDAFNMLDKKRIWHMHIKDATVDPQTKKMKQVCAVGDGVIPHKEIFQAMGKAGYTGALSMETHFSINGERMPASRRSMQGLLKVMDSLG